MNHTYEEIRDAAIDILAGRIKTKHVPRQYAELSCYISSILDNSGYVKNLNMYRMSDELSYEDSGIFLEVFWDLFRQGIITLGYDKPNKQFPWFRVSAHGKRILENQDVYFYHDVSSYEAVIKQQMPDIDDVTLIYLKEAMQSFYSGCYLSSSVMLGVASEHTFLKLLEKIENNSSYSTDFKNSFKERTTSRKFAEFKKILNQLISQNKLNLQPEVKENLDTNLDGIMNTIRNFRNDSGHPSGNIISREQCYVNLNLFIPYCKKAYQLIDSF
jgi:hypothetical protein